MNQSELFEKVLKNEKFIQRKTILQLPYGMGESKSLDQRNTSPIKISMTLQNGPQKVKRVTLQKVKVSSKFLIFYLGWLVVRISFKIQNAQFSCLRARRHLKKKKNLKKSTKVLNSSLTNSKPLRKGTYLVHKKLQSFKIFKLPALSCKYRFCSLYGATKRCYSY